MLRGGTTKSESRLKSYDRKDKQGFVDIKNMTVVQLEELIERQNKLLQNRLFLKKLPDKGEKIISFKTELETELKKKQEELEETCQLMLNLNLRDNTADEIEWCNGKPNTNLPQLDSDDDDVDHDDHLENGEEVVVNPLKMIATHSGTAAGRKIKINFEEAKSSVKIKDNNENKKSFYGEKICEKYEKSNKVNSSERFKPNQLKNNDKTLFKTSAEKVKNRLGDKWEITQATPPVPIYKDAVMISLNESLKLQKEQAEKLKEIEKKNATEKLLQNISVKMGAKLPENNVTEYRNSSNFYDMSNEDNNSDISDSDNEENEKTVFFEINNE